MQEKLEKIYFFKSTNLILEKILFTGQPSLVSGDGRGVDGWACQVKIHIGGQSDHILFVFSFDFAILGTLKINSNNILVI